MEEIEKTNQPNPDDVLTAITSFNDPVIIMNMFKELGWTYSFEIKEWLTMARQNANLAVKAKALIQLRKLIHEAAETAGFVANVSQTIPNAQGGQTTFSAKRMAGMLNPVKQIESTIIKEPENGSNPKSQPESESIPEINRGCNRKESQRPKSETTEERLLGGNDTHDQFPLGEDSGRTNTPGDTILGGLESIDGGKAPGQQSRAGDDSGRTSETGDSPCIQTRPPTCDPELYPGISTSAEEA